MAITITDARIEVDQADAVTNWSSPVGGEALTAPTSSPDPVESTASIGMAISTETGEVVATITAVDLSTTSTLVYVWTLANGSMDTTANGGVQLVLGDGTNTIGYHVAGSDVAGFRHEAGPVGWQCLVVDTGGLPATTTDARGTAGSLDLANVTEFGAQYKTLSKALGGAANCFTDIIRHGNGGIRVTAGTSGDTGKFSEMAADDRSSTSSKAYGIIRELGTGLYGLQGPLTFGDTIGTATTFFADTNTTVAFEDRGLGTDKYSITVQGNATGSTTFRLGTLSGTNKGVDGCSLICPVGVGASFTATDADLQSLLLYGTSFSNFDQGMLFSTDATNGPNHDIFSCSFTGCSQIDPGKVDFRNNTITGSTDANGSILLDADGTSTWSDLTFISDGTGHAIYITATGTYTFSTFTYSGFGATTTTDAVIYNNSGGAVTINVTGGDTPTYLNGASATTTIVSNVNVTITIQNQSGTVVPGAEVAIFQDDASRTVVLASTATDGSGQVATTAAASLGAIIIRVRQSTDIASFDTALVNTGTEVITTVANHNFRDGDAVVYDKDGGTDAIGLTDGNTYYVNNLTPTTLSLHPTAADAIANTNAENITATGTETHLLDPIRYVANSATGTIGSGDFSAQITMVTDSITTG